MEDVVDTSFGSIKLSVGDAQYIIAVKGSIVEVEPSASPRDFIKIGVRLQSSEYDFAIKKRKEDQLSSFLNDVVCLNGSDFSELIVIGAEKAFSWKITVDCFVLKTDGSILDHLSWGVHIALKSTKLPSVNCYKRVSDFNISKAKGMRKYGYQVDENEENCWTPTCFTNLPLTITATLVDKAIIFDPNAREEAAASGNYILTYKKNSHGKQKLMKSTMIMGYGHPIHESERQTLVEIAAKLNAKLYSDINQKIFLK